MSAQHYVLRRMLLTISCDMTVFNEILCPQDNSQRELNFLSPHCSQCMLSLTAVIRMKTDFLFVMHLIFSNYSLELL